MAIGVKVRAPRTLQFIIFIKDRIDNGELDMKCCGTDDMIADYFTKPLQGVKFIHFRRLIMNLPSEELSAWECVGEDQAFSILIFCSV